MGSMLKILLNLLFPLLCNRQMHSYPLIPEGSSSRYTAEILQFYQVDPTPASHSCQLSLIILVYKYLLDSVGSWAALIHSERWTDHLQDANLGSGIDRSQFWETAGSFWASSETIETGMRVGHQWT